MLPSFRRVATVAEFEVCAFTQIFTTDNGAAPDPVSYLEMLSLDRQARETWRALPKGNQKSPGY